MTILKIEWVNFQPHRMSVIKPSKALTVIVGTSRHGKSSLVRGVKWAVENKPRGEDFKNWNADDKESVAVGVTFEEGSNVVRERTPSYNQYHVSPINKPLRAIRSDVPEEVSSVTRMSSINIQSQLDPYFMLQPPYSPGEIGRMLNEAVELEIIDIHRDEIASLIRKTNAAITASDARLQEHREEVKVYDNLEEIREMIFEIEILVPQINEALRWLRTTKEIMESVGQLSYELKEIKGFLSMKKDVRQAINISQHVEQQERELWSLKDLMNMITTAEGDIKELNSWLEIKPYVEEMLEIEEDVSKLRLFRFSAEKILRDIYYTEEAVQSGSDALTVLYADRIKLFEQLSICPFCGQPITEDVLEHIKEME